MCSIGAEPHFFAIKDFVIRDAPLHLTVRTDDKCISCMFNTKVNCICENERIRPHIDRIRRGAVPYAHRDTARSHFYRNASGLISPLVVNNGGLPIEPERATRVYAFHTRCHSEIAGYRQMGAGQIHRWIWLSARTVLMDNEPIKGLYAKTGLCSRCTGKV